jgi:hypothetical protein
MKFCSFSKPKYYYHMIRNVLFLSIFILLISCGTTEEAADSETEEIAELEVDETLFPEWYKDGQLGEVTDGVLTGYAKSLGSDTDWAYNNARKQADTNLRVWIDDQVEVARATISDNNSGAADREFIIQLRNAVITLDFDDASVESDHFEYNGSSFVVVKIETQSSEVIERIGSRLGNYAGIWEEMRQTEYLNDW